MAVQDLTELLVKRKLKDEAQEVKSIAEGFRDRGQQITDGDITDFFPGLSDLESWTNDVAWSNRFSKTPITLPHVLILGLPCVFNLEPYSREVFLERNRIDIETATKLSDPDNPNRCLLPNLYVRNPAAWNGADHLNPLLQRSWANGERVNAYLQARDDRYNSFLETHENFLEDFMNNTWNTLDEGIKQQIMRDAMISGEPEKDKGVLRQIGTRWAYLDVLDGPSDQAGTSSAKLLELFQQGKYLSAFRFNRGAVNLVASQITASIGGYHVSGDENVKAITIAKLHGMNAQQSEDEKEIQGLKAAFKNPEAIEALISEITSVKCFDIFQSFPSERLVTILGNTEFRMKKFDLYDTLAKMVELASEDQPFSNKVSDFKRLIEDIRQQLNTFQRRTAHTTDISSISIGAIANALIGSLTGLADIIVDAAIGTIVGYVINKTIPSDTVGRGAFSIASRMNPRQRSRYLILTNIENFREMAGGSQ